MEDYRVYSLSKKNYNKRIKKILSNMVVKKRSEGRSRRKTTLETKAEIEDLL